MASTDKSAGIILYPEDIIRIQRSVKPQYQFAVIYALSRYAMDGTLPTEEELGEGGMVAFEFVFDKVRDALEAYKATSEKRRNAAIARWNANDANACTCTDMHTRALYTETETEIINKESKHSKESVADKRNSRGTKDVGSNARNARFTPPPVEEVEAYCRERGNAVDAQRFVDFYSSNGWRVGRNPMKDWRAAIRTWEKNEYAGKRDGGAEGADPDWIPR